MTARVRTTVTMTLGAGWWCRCRQTLPLLENLPQPGLCQPRDLILPGSHPRLCEICTPSFLVHCVAGTMEMDA